MQLCVNDWWVFIKFPLILVYEPLPNTICFCVFLFFWGGVSYYFILFLRWQVAIWGGAEKFVAQPKIDIYLNFRNKVNLKTFMHSLVWYFCFYFGKFNSLDKKSMIPMYMLKSSSVVIPSLWSPTPHVIPIDAFVFLLFREIKSTIGKTWTK